MVRKCRGTALLEEMAQVGVKTRAQALALAPNSSKKRKTNSNHEFNFSIKLRSTNSSPTHSRRRLKISPDKFFSVVNHAVTEDRCTSDHESASCCSSSNYNGSTSPHPPEYQRNIKFADLEEEEGSIEVEASMVRSCFRKRETSTTSCEEIGAEEREELSGNLDSPGRPSSPSEANSRRQRSSTVAAPKMPTDMELEDFFAEAEKKLQTQFAAKYNYDSVKDEPLEGRYEWVQLRP